MNSEKPVNGLNQGFMIKKEIKGNMILLNLQMDTEVQDHGFNVSITDSK